MASARIGGGFCPNGNLRADILFFYRVKIFKLAKIDEF